MKNLFIKVVLGLCLLSSVIDTSYANERLKVGLALSGGGAKGGAHIGVLKVLEELNVPIDYIAGTSAGSIVGGLYAAGYTPKEIEDVMVDTNWTETFNDRPSRPDKPFRRKKDDDGFLIKAHLGFNQGEFQFPLGVLQGQKLEQLFARTTFPVHDIQQFDDLRTPFRAVAADIETGEAVIIGEGNLANAIRASMSIPGLLSPVEWEGKLLVDGGIANNLPVDVVRNMGADIVIAVDISAPLSNKEELDSVLAVTGQLTTILTATNVAKQVATLTDQDIYIVPELDGIGTLDFNGAALSIPPGIEATRKFMDKLMPYSVAGHLYQDPEFHLNNNSKTTVSFIEINNNTNLNDQVILERMSIKTGDVLNLEKIEKDIEQIYGLDVFQEVSYELSEQGDETGLIIHAQKKSWGPNYLQFGMAIDDDFSGNSNYTFGVSYTRTAMNSLGGELRLEGNIGKRSGLEIDFYQPLDIGQDFYFNPEILAFRTNSNVFNDSNQVGEVQISVNQFSLGFGRNFGNNQSLKMELIRGHGKVDNVSGSIPDTILGSFDIGELDLLFEYDSLNSIDFPNSGNQFFTSYSRSLGFIGSDEDYYQYSLAYLHAQTHGRNTYLIQASAGYSNKEDIPIYKANSLGGFGNLSGLSNKQLIGPFSGIVGLAAYHRLGNIDLLPAYVGASVEIGNVWQTENDISFDNTRLAGSIFIGVDTLLGPVYLAYGRSEGNEESVYLFIGNPFGRN